jgi:hypothetical protein
MLLFLFEKEEEGEEDVVCVGVLVVLAMMTMMRARL